MEAHIFTSCKMQAHNINIVESVDYLCTAAAAAAATAAATATAACVLL